MSTNTIAVIIPIHEYKDYTDNLFKRAVNSIKSQRVLPDELIVVGSKDEELKKYLDGYDFGDIKNITTVVYNEGDDTSFQSQINYGASQCKSDFFTFLEYDDELSNIWVDKALEYSSHYPEVGIFLPIIFESDTKSNFLSFSNEGPWAKGFTEELGMINHDRLNSFSNFNIDGMVVKTSLIEEFGGLKSNMKLTFGYEFLLRMSFKSVPIMVIPKLGYKHTNNREGSLFAQYKQEIDVLESRFWLNQAKKEFYHAKDREITYETENG
jgi:glycosyltransferase involved in cell wall biosynthesis